MLNALLSAPCVRAKAMIVLLPRIIKKQADNEALNVYVTDALKVLTENTARFAGGSKMKSRFTEIVNIGGETGRKKRKPKDNRTGEQIAADIIGKIARKEEV